MNDKNAEFGRERDRITKGDEFIIPYIFSAHIAYTNTITCTILIVHNNETNVRIFVVAVIILLEKKTTPNA